jgi:hypothetical protein
MRLNEDIIRGRLTLRFVRLVGFSCRREGMDIINAYMRVYVVVGNAHFFWTGLALAFLVAAFVDFSTTANIRRVEVIYAWR